MNAHHAPRLGISDAVRTYGITARALRFYEEKGLISAGRDRQNCRYYDGVARRRLAWISRLRRAKVSLPEILEILTAEQDGGRGAEMARLAISRRRDELLRELAAVERGLAEIDHEPEPRPALRAGRRSRL